MKIVTRVLLTLLLSLSTIQMLRCARNNPFDPEGTAFNEGGAPWIAFVRDEMSSYTQDSTEFEFIWSDTGVGGTQGKIVAIEFDIDGDSVFELVDNDLSGSDTLTAKLIFDSELNSVIHARALDEDGNAGNVDSISLSVVSGRPYIYRPPHKVTSFPNDSVAVWCVAIDPNDRVVRYEWAVESFSFAYFTSDTSFNLPPFSSTGIYIARVRAVDSRGAHSDTAEIQVIVTNDPSSIDEDGPTIDFVGLNDGDTVSSSVLELSLRVEDEKNAVKLVSVNGIDAVLTGKFEPTYQCTISLKPGYNDITVIAVDAEFNRTTVGIGVVYDEEAVDQEPPQIQLLWPEEDQPVGVDSLTLSLQVTDPSGVSRVTANGKEMSRRSDNIWERGLSLEQGENLVEVIGVDRKGNIDTVWFSIEYDPDLYDKMPPVLTVSQPTDGVHIYLNQVTVSGSANDQSGIASLKVNSKSVTMDGDYWETTVELSHGENAIVVEAVDKSSSKNKTRKELTVIHNSAPEFLTKGKNLNRNIIVGTGYAPVFAFRDPDGDEVTLRFSQKSNWHSTKTPVLSVEDDTARVKNYVASKVGIDTFVVVAEDDLGDTAVLRWTVVVSEPGNTGPSFTTNPKEFPDTLLVDSTYGFVVSASDPDDTILNYILKKPPTPAAADIVHESGEITWTPSQSDTGSVEFEVWVSDGDKSDTLTWSMFVVMYNQRPDLQNPGDKNVDEGERLIFTLSATDPDGDALEYRFVDAPSWVKLSGNQCSVSPSYDDSGRYTVVIEASEKNRTPSLSDRETITITVKNVNRPPVMIDPGSKQVAEGVALSIELSADDPDDDDVSFYAAGAPQGSSVEGAVFTWNVPYDAPESVDVTFIAEDSGKPPLRDSVTVTISINNENRAPILEPVSDTTISENEQLRITLKGVDPDGGPVSYSMDSTFHGANLNDSIFTWTPTYDQAGSYSVTFYVQDNATPPLSDSIRVGITVLDVNRKPNFSAIPGQTVRENQELRFTLHAEDPDGDRIVYSLATTIPGASLTDSVFTWTPTYDQAGGYSVTFKAHDDGSPSLSDSLVVNITVQNVNRGPEITTDPESMISFVRVGNSVLDTVAAVDPDNDAVRFDIITGPTGMTIGESNGILDWTATLGGNVERDTIPVTVRVRDTYDAEDRISWNLVVQPKWPRRYGDKFDDVVHDALAVSSGGYVVCGALGTGTNGGSDGYLLRMTEDGDTVWTASISNPAANDEALAVAELPGGDFIVVGWTDFNGTRDVAVARVGPDGTIAWAKVYVDPNETSNHEVGFDVIVGDTEILICGIGYPSTALVPAKAPVFKGHRVSSDDYIFLLRIRTGDQGAKYRFEKPSGKGCGAFALKRISEEAVTLAGYAIKNNGPNTTQAYLVGLEYRTGEELWSKKYENSGPAALVGIDYLNSVHILVGTRTEGVENEWLISGANTEGENLWVRTFNAGKDGEAHDVAAAANGAELAYVCGNVISLGTGESQLVVKAISVDGDIVWDKNYGMAGHDDFGRAIDAGMDGHLIVGGERRSGGDSDGYIVRLDSDGRIAQ